MFFLVLEISLVQMDLAKAWKNAATFKQANRSLLVLWHNSKVHFSARVNSEYSNILYNVYANEVGWYRRGTCTPGAVGCVDEVTAGLILLLFHQQNNFAF